MNLEDISQPNCYKVLDALREDCDIPVWHDDAQGTGCVTLAGLINALRSPARTSTRSRIVFYGAGRLQHDHRAADPDGRRATRRT